MRGYFVQSNGTCSVVLMVTERINLETPAPLSAARLRLVLQPGAIARLDSAEGARSTSLAIVARQSCLWTKAKPARSSRSKKQGYTTDAKLVPPAVN
jgi:hypothetical protein